MPHLPDAHQYEDNSLSKRPPQYASIGAVTNLTETLLTNLKGKIKNVVANHNRQQETQSVYLPSGMLALSLSVQSGQVIVALSIVVR